MKKPTVSHVLIAVITTPPSVTPSVMVKRRVAALHSRCDYSELVGDMWALNIVLCERRHRITSLHMPQIYSRRNMVVSSINTAWEGR